MKGYFILTEGRSGSNWASSLANATRCMGVSKEWVDQKHLGARLNAIPSADLLHRIVELSRTSNGRFGIKLFPRHLLEVHNTHGIDLIREFDKKYDVSIILLTRRDRLRQAVSFAKARMTNQWRSDQPVEMQPRYDFELICRSYFHIERSYAYWRSYLQITEMPFNEFSYEDLVEDVGPYLSKLSELLDVEVAKAGTSQMQVQRDELSEEWLVRFRAELKYRDVVWASTMYVPPSRKFKNLWKLWKRQPMTPLPMNI